MMRGLSSLSYPVDFFGFFVVQLSPPHNPRHSIVRITYIVYH